MGGRPTLDIQRNQTDDSRNEEHQVEHEMLVIVDTYTIVYPWTMTTVT